MKTTLLLQAQYNKFANTNMFATLQKAPKEVLYKDRGLYYGSIMQTAEHNLCGAISITLRKFSAFSTQKLSGLDEIFGYVTPEMKLQSDIYNDISAFAALQEKVDSKIIELIESIDDFEKIETLAFPGIEFKKLRGFLILALLNHSIHHRGQIAGALDCLKIENDFNGMLGMQ
ncbi:damage-inducible protein DinB [Helicobacter sp. MIT 11-5569]|uniref:DinB family protein n=1 Tax=Helicobacter sp. MIT 11-5569 TaxID=1548151 RepID=UPI00051FB1B9|nr:DinB family protein [Helicobacter sp. MIT 11-5569]TLD83285.1 damage-inducible protein DinB [Helicobacter sp. MIT 11-5569]